MMAWNDGQAERAPAPTIDATFVPRRSPEVEWVEIEGEAVLYEQRTNEMHVLNAPAALLWACFDGETTVGDVAADISEATQIDIGTILRDVTTTVRTFAESGLLADFERPVGASGTDPDTSAASTLPTATHTPRVLAPPPDG